MLKLNNCVIKLCYFSKLKKKTTFFSNLDWHNKLYVVVILALEFPDLFLNIDFFFLAFVMTYCCEAMTKTAIWNFFRYTPWNGTQLFICVDINSYKILVYSVVFWCLPYLHLSYSFPKNVNANETKIWDCGVYGISPVKFILIHLFTF